MKGVGGPAATKKAAKRCTDAERKRDSAQPQVMIRMVGPTLMKGVGGPTGTKKAAKRCTVAYGWWARR